MSNNTKPLADWTLGEAKTECRSLESCVECRLSKDGECRLSPAPQRWDLTEKPRFTEDEMDVLKALYSVGARYLARGKHLRWYHNKPYIRAEDDKWGMKGDWGTGSGKLPKKLFPTLRPGQSIAIADIITQKENRPG